MTLLGAAITAPSAAVAACSQVNATVTCSGATLDQGPGPNTGYGSGSETGLTVNVQASASVAGTSVGIDVGDNNTINNLGTVTTAGNGLIGDVFGINANGINLTVNNSGTIGRIDIANNLFDAAGINAGTGLSVTNNAGATIQGAIAIQGVGTGTVVNSGLISGLIGGGGEGIDFAADTTSQVKVTNNATGVITGDAFGINAANAVVFNSGTISAPTPGNFGTGLNANTLVLTNYASGLITGDGFGVSGTQTPNLTITNLGTISSTGFAGVAIEGNTVNLVNSGTVSSATGSAGQAIVMASGSVTNNAGGTISGDTGILAAGNTSVFNAGTITGIGGTAIAFSGGGNTLTLAPGSVINGTAQGSGADTFQLGGTGTASFDASLLLTQYSGYATFNKVGASTWSLTGTNATAMPWNVNAGTLEVVGTIVNATMTVNAGGTLGGTGTVGSVTVNSGGTLMPGLPATVGTLQATSVTFASGASYLITINGASNSKVTASGAATLNSGAIVNIASGSTINANQTYTILTAAGGVSGHFSPNVTFGAFKGALSYHANDVFLTFSFASLAPLLPPGAPINVVNVANAIDNFTNNGGNLPPGFANLATLSSGQLQGALTQLSGELGTGAQLSGFQLMNQFMSLLLDPLANGHGFGVGPLPFAPAEQQTTFTPEVADAYASVLKAPVAPITAYGPWRAWGAAYGGSNSITGDPAVVGSHDVRTTAGGFAAGLDYRVSPDTVLGIALAGAATGWDLSAGLGSGHSDAFQAGAYAKHQFGPAYVAGALAFANYWASTTRAVTVAGADTLHADFNAQSFGGRLEGGYQVSLAPMTVTPYAALQAQSFRLPGYAETAASGSPQFALSYAAQTSTATRAELGSWLSRNLLLAGGDTAVLFGRVAWAHDWFSNLAVTPSFQALPGAGFVVNGAAPPHDLALVTAGAEWRMRSNWSLMGRFDGEFGNGQQTYTGTARVRYAW